MFPPRWLSLVDVWRELRTLKDEMDTGSNVPADHRPCETQITRVGGDLDSEPDLMDHDYRKTMADNQAMGDFPFGTPEFPLSELIVWLETAQSRWEGHGEVTARLSGSALAIFQDGKYRAAIQLDEKHPMLSEWADDDA
jgi:hypothetical protein